MKYFTILLLLILAGCSSSNNPEPAKLTNGASYFPIANGDTWYFSVAGDTAKIVRTVSNDTTVNNINCKRVLENNVTTEAWTVDTVGFKLHLAIKDHRFDPPLLIPFNLVQGKPYSYQTTVYFFENGTEYYSDVTGTLTFDGYVTKPTRFGNVANAIKLHYMPDDYYEYYGIGLGLLDNGSYVLDSAFIGGVWHK